MEIIRPGINLDFIGRMKVVALVSVVLVALVLLLMVGRVLTGRDAFNGTGSISPAADYCNYGFSKR